VPPIYQPEIAARAIVLAAEHPRRELNVGFLTSLILFLNKFFPGVGDHYLAQTGFKSQMTDEKRDPASPQNLWEAAPGNFGAHGRFDHRAIDRSPHLWVNAHRKFAIGLLAALALSGIGLYRKWK
jgi:hypothetical protein